MQYICKVNKAQTKKTNNMKATELKVGMILNFVYGKYVVKNITDEKITLVDEQKLNSPRKRGRSNSGLMYYSNSVETQEHLLTYLK